MAKTSEQLTVLRSLTQQSAARLLGCLPRFFREHNVPRNDDATYNAMDVVKWYVEYLDLESNVVKVDRHRDIKTELLELDLQERQLKLKVAEGELVRFDDIQESLDRLADLLRAFGEALDGDLLERFNELMRSDAWKIQR